MKYELFFHLLCISLAIFGIHAAGTSGMIFSGVKIAIDGIENRALMLYFKTIWKMAMGCAVCMSTIYTPLYAYLFLKTADMQTIILLWLMVAGFNFLINYILNALNNMSRYEN